MRRTLTTKLRGRDVEIDYALQGADPSVGLSEGFEDEVITDATTGERLAWDLTDDEVLQISTVVGEQIGGEDTYE